MSCPINREKGIVTGVKTFRYWPVSQVLTPSCRSKHSLRTLYTSNEINCNKINRSKSEVIQNMNNSSFNICYVLCTKLLCIMLTLRYLYLLRTSWVLRFCFATPISPTMAIGLLSAVGQTRSYAQL